MTLFLRSISLIGASAIVLAFLTLARRQTPHEIKVRNEPQVIYIMPPCEQNAGGYYHSNRKWIDGGLVGPDCLTMYPIP